MALFRRRSTSEAVPAEDVDDVAAYPADVDASDQADADESADQPGYDRVDGPFDQSEADRADQDLPRLDLGALRIPGLPGVAVQVEADQNTQEVRAVTGVAGDAGVQLLAFAAPRSEGLWEEIRAEMLSELRSASGARVSEEVGAFGPELRAVVPARTPEGQQIMQPLRFVGIDGPRWFLRVVFLGRAAVEPDPQDDLHQLVRQTIVVRGPEAMAPRDPLPLHLPEQQADFEAESAESHEPDDGDDENAPDARYADLDPFARGPEITEVR